MKAAVFSDSHGNTALMEEAVRRIRPDVIIHLGDHERDAMTLRRIFPEIPLYSVCGNCDIMPMSPARDLVPLGPVKAFITHGHLYGVKLGAVHSLVYAAQEQGASIALFGHTHEPFNDQLGGVHLVNPGTAGKGYCPTYALIEVFDNGGVYCSIKDL